MGLSAKWSWSFSSNFRSYWLVIAGLALTGCPEPTQSKSADPTRALSPVPACVKNLPPGGDDGYVNQLGEDEYWGLLIPGWGQKMDASPELKACNGESLFDSEVFAQTNLDPASRMEGRVTYGGGANRLKIVWLRSHSASGGVAAGPLALMRVVGNHAEAYGVTAFRGNPDQVRFDLERLGGEVVVTAITDGCAGATSDCDTNLLVLRPNAGRLDTVAEIGLQRVRAASGLEPGVPGALTVRLVASPEYTAEGIEIIEEFSVSDQVGRTLRKAQIERAYLLQGAKVVETDESLWSKMYLRRIQGKQEPVGHKSGEAKKDTTPSSSTSANAGSSPKSPQSEAREPSVSSTIAVEELR